MLTEKFTATPGQECNHVKKNAITKNSVSRSFWLKYSLILDSRTIFSRACRTKDEARNDTQLCEVTKRNLRNHDGNGDKDFSKSLVIHEEKTKEITTVKEVWICDPNYHKIR